MTNTTPWVPGCIGLTLASLLACGPTVGANEEPTAKAVGFVERLDADGDGKVSKDEFDGPEKRFAKLDRNHDGFLSGDEAPGSQGGPEQSFVERWDSDRDGKVSKAEFDGSERLFSHLDRDGDGFVTATEAPAGQGATTESFLERWDTDGDGKVSKAEFDGPEDRFGRLDQNGDGFVAGEELARVQSGAKESFLERWDADGDGKVSKAEFDGPEDRFGRLDQNGDGFVDSEEAPQAASRKKNPKRSGG